MTSASSGAVAVMGAGAWGTALAKVLVDAGGPETGVTLWTRRPELAEQINSTRYNPDYLPGTLLPPGIRATADAAEALRDASTVLLGVPAQIAMSPWCAASRTQGRGERRARAVCTIRAVPAPSGKRCTRPRRAAGS